MNPNATNSSKIIHSNNSNSNVSSNKLFNLTATKKCLMQSRKSIRAIFEPLHKLDDSQSRSPQVRDIKKESLPMFMTPPEKNKSLKMNGGNNNNNSNHRKNRDRGSSDVKHILQAIKSSKRPSIYNTININKNFGSKYRVRGASNSVSKQPSINMIKEKYGPQISQSPKKLQNKNNKIIASSPSPRSPRSQSPSHLPRIFPFPLSKTKVSITELTKKPKGDQKDARDAADTEAKSKRTEQQQQHEGGSRGTTTTSYKMSEISNYNPHKDPQVFKLFSSSKVKGKNPNTTLLNQTPSQQFLSQQQTQENENSDLAANSSVNPFKGYSKSRDREKRKNSIYEILAWKGKGGNWNGPQVKSSYLNKSSLFRERESVTPSGLKRSREQEFRSLYRRIKVTYFLQDEAYSNVMVPEKLSRVIQNLNNFEAELVDYLAVPDPHPQAAVVLEDLRNRRNYLVAREQKALLFSNNKTSKTKEFPGIASSLFRAKTFKRIPSTATPEKATAKGKERFDTSALLRSTDGSKQKLSNAQRSSSSYVTARKYSSKKIKIVGKALIVKPKSKRARKKIGGGADPSKFMSKAKVKEKQIVEEGEDGEIYQKLKVLESFLKTRPKSKETDKMLHEVATSISKFPVPSSVPILEFKTSNKIPGVNSPPVKTKWKKSDFIRLLPHPGEITKNVSEVDQKRSQPLREREDTKPYMSWLEEIMARKLENEIGVEVEQKTLPDTKPKPVLKSIGTGKNPFGGLDLRGPNKTGQFPRWAKIMTKGGGNFVRFKPKTEAIKSRTPPQLSVQHIPTTQTITVPNNNNNTTTTNDMQSQQSVAPSPSNHSNRTTTTNYKHVMLNDKPSENKAFVNQLGNANFDRQQRKQGVELNSMLDAGKDIVNSAKNNSPQVNFNELNIQSLAQNFTPKNDSSGRPTYFSALLNMDDNDSTDVSTLFQPKDTYGKEQMSVMSIHGNFMDIHNFKKRTNIIGQVREYRDRSGKNTVNLNNEPPPPPATTTSKSKYIHPPFQPGNLLSIVNFPQSLGLRIRDKRLASNRVKFPIPNYYPPVNT